MQAAPSTRRSSCTRLYSLGQWQRKLPKPTGSCCSRLVSAARLLQRMQLISMASRCTQHPCYTSLGMYTLPGSCVHIGKA